MRGSRGVTDTERREFQAYGECPGCSTPGYHLLAAPREQVEWAPTYFVEGERDPWWPMDGYEMTGTGSPVAWYIRSGLTTAKRTVTIVDRECLSCDQKWEETE